MRAFELDHGGTRRLIRPDTALAAARAGTPVVLEGALRELGFLDRLTDLYLDEVSAVTSTTVAREVRAVGLQRIHDFLDADQVVEVITRLDKRAADYAVPLSRALVEATTSRPPPHYFICARTWIRAQVPYRLVEGSPHILQTGHLFGHLLPVAAHRDSWLSHPRGSVSLWSAVGPVREGNSIALFEAPAGSPDRALTPSLAPGDVLMFNADILHASVHNDTEETRVTVGNRVMLGRHLRFGPGTSWRPWYDAAMLDTPLAPFATLQSRVHVAALRRWRWRRRWTKQRQAAVLISAG